MTTGEKIRAARKKAGLTQSQLGEILSISYVGVSQWENGLRNPKIETLKKIAEALGVNYLDLYGDADSKEVAAHMKEGIRLGLSAKSGIKRSELMAELQQQGYSFDPDETRLVKAFNLLNDTGRAQVLLLTEGMAELPQFMLDAPEHDQ